jgi:tight adherence protein C
MTGTVILLVGLAACMSAPLVAALAFLGRDAERGEVTRALATIERGYAAALATGRKRSFRERIVQPFIDRVGNLGRALTPTGGIARLQQQLDYCGNPPGWPVERVVAAKGVFLVVGLVAGAALGAVYGGLSRAVFCGVLGAVAGFFGPDLTIYNTGVKRQDEIRMSLPDVLDTLTVSVEAGQGFDAALSQVSRNGKGPMVGETARVLQEMRIGKSRVEALRSMAARTTVPELKGFASAMVQASELGVPMATVLREQAREMRLRRRQRAEEQAQKVPIKLLFPTMLCLFPALFVVILGPGVLRIMGVSF